MICTEQRRWGWWVCVATATVLASIALQFTRGRHGCFIGEGEQFKFDVTAASQRPQSLTELLTRPAAQLESLDVGVLDLVCAEELPGAGHISLGQCLATLDQWADHVKRETARNLYRFRTNPEEYGNSEGYFRMLMMAVVVSEDFHVRCNADRVSSAREAAEIDGFFADSRDVFLHGLLGPRRMGTCSSMPILYLALGRRLGYPLKLVTTQAHLFLRWESETERFNLEATGRGMNRYDDEHYKEWPFALTEHEINENGYLRSLTAAEELAVFLTIRSQCLKEADRLSEARTMLAYAVRLAPHVQAYRLLLTYAETKLAASQLAPQPVAQRAEVDPLLGQTDAARGARADTRPNLNPLLRNR